MRWLKLSIVFSVSKCIGWSPASIIHFESILEIKGNQSARGEGEENATRYGFSIQFSSVPFVPCIFSLSLSFFLPSLSLFLCLFPSCSVTCNSRRGWSTPRVSCEERNEEEEKPSVDRERRTKGERGGIVGGVESISKLQATPFDPLSPLTPLVSRHPPVAFSRFLSSGKATPPLFSSLSFSLSLSLSFSLSLFLSLLFARQRARLEYWYWAKSFFP